MSVLSYAPFSNVTTYRKDYAKKIPQRRELLRPQPDYKNPISGPYEEYLLPNFKYQRLPKTQTEYPDPRKYAEELVAKYPSSRITLQEPPDFNIIDKFYDDDDRTTYMVSYCVLGDYDSKRKRGRTTRTLPEGWVVPLTTQKCSYRNPFVMAPEGIRKDERLRPKNNLEPNERKREILEVKTGETIYISDISNTGMEIIKGKLHGDVNIRPQFDPDELLRAKLIRTK